MIKKLLFIIFILFTVAGLSFGNNNFSVNIDYNIPISNESIDQNLSFGADYQFWGIFQFTGNIYTDIVYGADNIFNIKRIVPIGLFSFGIGLNIPLGGFFLLFDYEKYYTGTAAESGIYDFCDSVRAGISIDLSSTFGFEFYNRRLLNFSQKTVNDKGYRITKPDDAIGLLGMGVNFHLF